MSNIYDALLDLVFPPRCPGCRARGVLLCPRCIEQCKALRLPSGVLPRRSMLITATGLYHYDAPLRQAIHAFKYRRRRTLAGPLGDLLVAALPDAVRACDAVVPVPLHPGRLRERGFNQSALLAERVAAILGLPLAGGLGRVRATPHQVGLDRIAREENVRGAFVWEGAAPPDTVLLVDDVLTTGATIQECARALRAAGAREVKAIALASG